jgi:ABC-type polar amino acid transport system ATPase subunit
MGFACDVADRILFVDKGIIVESGTPDQLFSHPEDDRTRLFLEPIRKVQQI